MDALSDINPNDPICSSPYPIETQMVAQEYRATFTQSQLNELLADLNKCIDDCKAKYTGEDEQKERGKCYEQCRWRKYGDYNPLILFRKMGLDTQIPLLGKTRDYTIGDFASGGKQKGIFDIFRPAEMSFFEDDPAKSNIGYSYQGTISNSPIPGEKEKNLMKSSSEARPGVGEFYFPYLGGIEKAKQCVSRGILNPNTQEGKIISQQYCP